MYKTSDFMGICESIYDIYHELKGSMVVQWMTRIVFN